MLDLRECLFVTFTYDHSAGVYYAQLSNGSRFVVERQHISGKLENALTLHKRAVIALNSGKYVQARDSSSKQLEYSYDEDGVIRYTRSGERNVALPSIELDLSDLEL